MTIGVYTDYTPPGTALPLRVPIGASSSHGPENFQEFSKSVADAIALTHLNPQTGTTYTFVLADATRLVTASNASAQTYTVPPQASVAWKDGSALVITNLGAGVVTFAQGVGVTITNIVATLGQFETATLIRTGLNAWTVIKGGGAPKAVVSGVTGSPATDTTTRPGKTIYNWTGNGSITVSKAGVVEMRLVGGGGGGGFDRGGGGSGGQDWISYYVWLDVGTHTVTIGAGGAGGTSGARWGMNGEPTRVGSCAALGGGGGGGSNTSAPFLGGQAGAYGGGGNGVIGASQSAGAAQDPNGYAGSAGTSNGGGGGGGGRGGAPGSSSGSAGGNGGAGRADSTITGTSATYGAGGGGGAPTTAGTGGTGGGGSGVTGSGATGNAGAANTGGGGGGGGPSSGPGGAGGSGRAIVVVG